MPMLPTPLKLLDHLGLIDTSRLHPA